VFEVLNYPRKLGRRSICDVRLSSGSRTRLWAKACAPRTRTAFESQSDLACDP